MAQPRVRGRFASGASAMERFLSFCRFEPETGCVLWIGGKTKGRGHHVDYGSFWFEGRRWFAHRWSAKHIHGFVIDGFDVDHWCPHKPKPDTLCVEHVKSETPARNRELQTMRNMIHLQVGLIEYRDLYGPDVEDTEERLPFFNPPSWLNQGPTHDHAHDCPF